MCEKLPARDLVLLNDASCVHALPELPLVLALHAVPDSFEDVVHGGFGSEVGLCASLVYTSLDEDRVPVGFIGVLIELVGPPDVGLGSITYKVHSLRSCVNAVCVLTPPLEKTSSELKGADLGLAKGRGFQLLAGNGFVHSLEGDTKSSHTNTSKVVRCAPDNIVVRKEDWRTLVEVLRPSTKAAVLGHEQVQDNLLIGGPVARVGEHE